MNDAHPRAEKRSTSRPDRRRWERLPLWIPVFVRGTDEQGRRFLDFTSTLNVSAGGILLAVRRSLRPSSQLSVEVPAAPVPASFGLRNALSLLKCDVLRVQHCGDGFVVALSFASPLAAVQP
jgi:hypothetical protein